MKHPIRACSLLLFFILPVPAVPGGAGPGSAAGDVIVRYTDGYASRAQRLAQLLADAGYRVDAEAMDNAAARRLGNALRYKVLHLGNAGSEADAIREIIATGLGQREWATQRARPLVGTDGRLLDPREALEEADGERRYLVHLYPQNDDARFFEAAAEGDTAAVTRLLAAGMDVDVRDHTGSTALMIAAREGHVGVVDALLSAGADVHVRSRHDTTALLNAVYMNHFEVVRLLVGSGADAGVSNIDGTAMEIAYELYHVRIAEFLKEQLKRLEI